jgi:hypothetical protein
MTAYWLGQLLGYLLFSIVVPALLLMVLNLTTLKHRPTVTYGICGVIAVTVPLLALRGHHAFHIQPILASSLGGLLFFFDYRRQITTRSRSS